MFIACVAVDGALAADQRIVFERGDAMYTANLSASVIRKLGSGTFPAMSPNGKSVAVTVVSEVLWMLGIKALT